MRASHHFLFAALSVGAFVACSAPDVSSPQPGSWHTGSPQPGTGTPGSGTPGNTGGTNGNNTGGNPGGNTGGNPGGNTGTNPPPSGNTISANETWSANKQISGSVIIAAGVTVTIAPSAQITVADAAVITVEGTLTGTSPVAAHAKLTGTAWGGLVVASGGTLSLDGVDLANAATAFDTRSGNVAATYKNGIVTAPTVPFNVETGSKLSLINTGIVGTKGSSIVAGAFTASYLDYDSNGNEGLTIKDPTAVFTVDDSRFHGTSNGGGDMIVANSAATLHIAHSEIQKCHCAFHFNGITNFDISFMTLHDDSYGFMMYGSDAATGTRTVKSSNFETLAGVGVAESGTNGPIAVTGCYFNAVATTATLTDAVIKISATTTAPVAGVGPRPGP